MEIIPTYCNPHPIIMTCLPMTHINLFFPFPSSASHVTLLKRFPYQILEALPIFPNLQTYSVYLQLADFIIIILSDLCKSWRSSLSRRNGLWNLLNMQTLTYNYRTGKDSPNSMHCTVTHITSCVYCDCLLPGPCCHECTAFFIISVNHSFL